MLGKLGFKSQPRIIDGFEAVPNSLPWTARIYEYDDETLTICGASLIASQWVVTAAHCLRTNDPNIYTVVLGEHDASSRDGKEQFHKVVQLIYNDFNTQTGNNDIALMKLAKPVVYNDYVSPICLPEQDLPTDADY